MPVLFFVGICSCWWAECLLSVSGNASGCLQQEAGRLALPFLLSKLHQLSHRHRREAWGLWFWTLAWGWEGRRERERDCFFDSVAVVNAFSGGNAANPSLELVPWHKSPDAGHPLSQEVSNHIHQQSNAHLCEPLQTLLLRCPLGWDAMVPGDGPCSWGARDEWLGTIPVWIWVSSENVGQFQPGGAASSIRSCIYWFGSLRPRVGNWVQLLTAGGGSWTELCDLLRWDTKPCWGKSTARPEAAQRRRIWWEQEIGAGGHRALKPSKTSGDVKGQGGHASWMWEVSSSPFDLHFIEKSDCIIWRLWGDPNRFPLSYCHLLWWDSSQAIF